MNSLRLIPKLVRKLVRKPALMGELALYVKNDLLSLLGVYRYEYPVIFIAGLPKSGTTWLETQIARVPGYNLRPINDPRAAARNHDISDELFEALPRRGYSVLKLHTRYSAENLAVIRRHVPRFLVTIRDLRDMCVSGYFHVKHDPGHPQHALYQELPQEAGLMDRIEVTVREYLPWVRDWLRVADNDPDRMLVVRYEDLNRDPYSVFKRTFEFFNLPAEEALLRELEQTKLREERELAVELEGSTGLRTRSTARKGTVGDWRNHFSASHTARFKELAADLLIEAGYERDRNW